MEPSHAHHRRASMYVMVLGSTVAVTVIGLSALMLVRVERASAEGTADLSAARFLAQSGLEIGQHRIRADSNWRTTNASGVWAADVPLGTGRFTLEGIDADDGNLSNSSTDPVVLRGTGVQGPSRYKLEVMMVSKSQTLTCLQTAMHAGGALNFSGATVQSNLVTISTNNSATTSGTSTIHPRVEAVNAINGTGYQSSNTSGVPARTMPAATVFDSYILSGTTIAYSSISNSGGGKTIDRMVLSPNINPWGTGTKNANGIYVIDCQGGALRIQRSRIVGTVVILNPGIFSVEGSVNWEPAIANYPALLVRGNAQFSYTNTALSESSNGTNYNPPGTPYVGGYNNTTTDSYPSIIKGLIYASGDVTTTNYVTIDGVLVIGVTLNAQGTLSLTYRSTFYDNPPPGFGSAPQMVISAGTWKQLVD